MTLNPVTLARACRPVISSTHTLSRTASLSSSHAPSSLSSRLPHPPQPQPQPQHVRYSSHSSMGAPPAVSRKKVTIASLRSQYKKGDRITMLTAHDFPSAHVADHAGMDIILVGDSLAMVALGMNDTNEVTLDDMILHCRSVARATQTSFTVSPTNFTSNAYIKIKECVLTKPGW